MRIFDTFRNIFKIKELANRIYFTLAMLIVFRLGSHVVLPGISREGILQFQGEAQKLGGVWDFIQIFSGGALGNLALFALGIMPYITSSIIMQLMTKVSPTLEAMAKEGPAGQRRISQYTRYLAIPICIVQALFATNALKSFAAQYKVALFTGTGYGVTAEMVIGLTGGALFVMWLGEQITEHGLGNGASILIMANIVARMPQTAHEFYIQVRGGELGADSLFIMTALFVAAIAGTVFVTQAQRRIPLQHAKHFRGRRVSMGSRNYLPLRVNTSGVMPVIFASSLLVIPSMLAFIPGLGFMRDIMSRGYFFYTLFYVAMIFFFSYFWTYLFFQPHEMANNLKEYGSFVPGIRPGENTGNYLNTILARITLAGAAFLCAIALIPDLAAAGFNMDRKLSSFLGGTGILIVVGVSLDIVQKTESYLLMHHYEGFVGPGGIRGRRG